MNAKIKFLYLSEAETREAGAGNMAGCAEAMEETLRLVAEGDYVMGGPNCNSHGLKIYFPKESPFPKMPVEGADRRFMALVAYLGGRFNVCALKWYGSNIANREKGLPRSIHILTLNDPETGSPLCIMAGNLISTMRTGAMAGVGAKHLARRNAEVLALIGTGIIGGACCEAVMTVKKSVKKIRVYDIEKAQAAKAAAIYAEKYGVQTVACKDLRQAVEGSDIINLAASGPEKPVVEKAWLKEGALLIVLSDCRLGKGIMPGSKIAVDNWKMYEAYSDEYTVLQASCGEENPGGFVGGFVRDVQAGEINRENIVELGPVVAGKTAGRASESERIVFILDGMGVEDAAWSSIVYQNAVKMSIGTWLPLF